MKTLPGAFNLGILDSTEYCNTKDDEVTIWFYNKPKFIIKGYLASEITESQATNLLDEKQYKAMCEAWDDTYTIFPWVDVDWTHLKGIHNLIAQQLKENGLELREFTSDEIRKDLGGRLPKGFKKWHENKTIPLNQIIVGL